MFAGLDRLLGWLREGYPQGIPAADYVPLLALLRRRLSDEEIAELRENLVSSGLIPANTVDVGAEYLRITDELPSPAELQRVTDRLREAGHEITDVTHWRGAGETPRRRIGPDEGPEEGTSS